LVSQGSRYHAESGAGLSLAIAGQYQQQAFAFVGFFDRSIDNLLFSLHACTMFFAFIFNTGQFIPPRASAHPHRRNDYCNTRGQPPKKQRNTAGLANLLMKESVLNDERTKP